LRYVIRRGERHLYWNEVTATWGKRSDAAVFIGHGGERVVDRLRRSGHPNAALIPAEERPHGVPRKALAIVLDLAENGKFDKYGEGDCLDAGELAAVADVRRFFKLENKVRRPPPRKGKRA
jgi:hypothetical protein